MAKRDVAKTIANTKINGYYDLDLQDIEQLVNLSATEDGRETQLNLIQNAFKYGFAMGKRAKLAEIVKANGMVKVG